MSKFYDSDSDDENFQSALKIIKAKKIGVKLTGTERKLYELYKNNVEFLSEQKKFLEDNKTKMTKGVWNELYNNTIMHLDLNKKKKKVLEKIEVKVADIGIIIDNEQSFNQPVVKYFKDRYRKYTYLDEKEFDPSTVKLKYVWVFHTPSGPRIDVEKAGLLKKLMANTYVGGIVFIISRNVVTLTERIIMPSELGLRNNQDFIFHVAFAYKKFQKTENNKYVMGKFENYLE